MKPNKSRLHHEHQGSILTADRLKRGLAYVKRKKTWTSIQMTKDLNIVSARDLIRALKSNSIPISTAEFVRTTDSGARVYRWRLEE